MITLTTMVKWQRQIKPVLFYGLLSLLLVLPLAVADSPAVADHPKLKLYSKVPEAVKIDSKLLQLEQQVRSAQAAVVDTAAEMAMATVDGQLQVNLVTQGTGAQAVSAIQRPGVTVLHASPRHNRVAVTVDDPAVVYDLAKLPEVRMIMPEYGSTTQVGSVTSRADIALRSDVARTTFDVNGTGQVVGILSDSFAHTESVRDADTVPAIGEAGTLMGSVPQETGDLPMRVDLRRDNGATDDDGQFDGADEGAAMAELVHDIAPGAALAFHTAFGGQAVFADGISDLCTDAGATVMVDDVIYFAEPMYQDGIIAQAAADCVARGVPFFSSAGNNANRGFRQAFVDVAPDDDDESLRPTGHDLHDWGDGDGFLAVTVPPTGSFIAILQWNQPFASVNPDAGAQIDLDLYAVLSPDAAGLAQPIARSTSAQGTPDQPFGDAVEGIQFINPKAVPITVYLAVEHFVGSQEMIPQESSTPLELRLVFFDRGPRGPIEGIDDGTSAFGASTMYGHKVAPGVVSVAAVPWFDTPEFDPAFEPTDRIDPEFFTSRGGEVTLQFDTSGNFAPRTSFEPDLAAVDGNNNTFFGRDIDLEGFEGEPDGFPNFFGTSAAAPNAAAVAALIREANGSISPADIEELLKETARDVDGFRAAVGPDDVTGAGLIDAQAALEALEMMPSAAFDFPQ